MAQNSFDAAGFIQVELQTGTIHAPQDMEMTLLPMDVVDFLSPTPGAVEAAKKWGRQRGDVFLSKVDVIACDMEVFSQHVQGELALIGVGRASIDVYGDALLFKLQHKRPISELALALIEGFLSGFLCVIQSQVFEVAALQNIAGETLLIAGNETALAQVATWVQQGDEPMNAVKRLHQEVA